MNERKEIENNLAKAYESYKNNNITEAVSIITKDIETLLSFDERWKDDPYWALLSRDVYAAIVLNNYHKGQSVNLTDISAILKDEKQVRTNIDEFVANFKNNSNVSFIDGVTGLVENPLKSAIEILDEQISKLVSYDDNVKS